MTATDTPTLSHVNPRGGVQMVDISEKNASARTAVAFGRVLVGEEAFGLIGANKVRKGDVLGVAQIAGIMGAKQTSKLIPLCHDVALKGVDLEFEMNPDDFAVEINGNGDDFVFTDYAEDQVPEDGFFIQVRVGGTPISPWTEIDCT